MKNPKTHFEQVPLEKIREIIKVHREETAEETPSIEENRSGASLLEATIVIEDGQR